ncbi:MAG: hypothetical protein ACTSQG_06940 [Promethearchaeota archaeon]
MSLNDLSLEYIKNDLKMKVMLDIYWVYNSFLEVDVPKSTFSVKLNDFVLFEAKSGILELLLGIKFGFPTQMGSLSNIKKSGNLEQKFEINNYEISSQIAPSVQASSSKYPYCDITDYNSLIIGGYNVSYNEKTYRHKFFNNDNDTLPNHYDIQPTNPNEMFEGFDMPGYWDDDFDGILDTNEYGLSNKTAKTHYLAPDSDFDGLNDKWERDNETLFEDYGLEPLNASRPDLIVEVDWIKGCKPITEEEEKSYLKALPMVLSFLLTLAIGSAVFSAKTESRTAKILLGITSIALILSAFALIIYRPREPFKPLKEYFLEKGVNLNIILDDELTGYGDGKGITSKDLNDIRNNEHDRKEYAVYSIFVYSLEGGVGGWANDSWGAAVTIENNQWGNRLQKVFGHELYHCLNGYDREEIPHSKDDPIYTTDGYLKDQNNYISKLGEIYLNLYFEEWQWRSIRLNYKRSVEDT